MQIHHPAHPPQRPCQPRTVRQAPRIGTSGPHVRSQARLLPTAGSCGHFASKSRRYSTTLGAIRGERRNFRQRQAAEDIRELLDEVTTLVVSHWEFTGVGYLTSGDTALALAAAARARERRQAARDTT